MINLKSTILTLFVCAAFQASGGRMKVYPLDGLNKKHTIAKVGVKSGLLSKTKRLIEVEPQPWGLGIAAFFTIFGVLVFKVRTPRPTLFNSNKF